jgi:hypothetical protein
MQFWQTDCRYERLTQLRVARNGGSINPHHYGVIKSRSLTGRLDIRPQSEIVSAKWDTTDRMWSIEVQDKSTSENATIVADYVVSATGGKMAFRDLAFLKESVLFPLIFLIEHSLTKWL